MRLFPNVSTQKNAALDQEAWTVFDNLKKTMRNS